MCICSKRLRVPIRGLPHHASPDQQLVVKPAPVAPAELEIAAVQEAVITTHPLEVEPPEDVDYTLRDEVEIVAHDNYDYLLDEEEGEEDEGDQEQAWNDGDEDDELAEEEEVTDEAEYQEIEDEVEEEEEEEVEEPTQSHGQRFTWESPERWWDHPHNGGAAAA